MTDLISRIVAAHIRQEGAPLGALNPGRLRSAPWQVAPLTENGFWKPGSRNEGIAGLTHQVALNVARGYSLRQHIERFAPPAENNTEAYIANVKLWASIPDENRPLWDFIGDICASEGGVL